MLDNCFRFAPRDSIPGLIAKICKYLKEHPGWSEGELEEQIRKFISSVGVESFNGRIGNVTLDKNDVNNLKIASAYFAEGNESIDSLDLVSLYNQGVRFVFTDFNSVTSGYNLAFVLDYFDASGEVVYYPVSTGSGGGGNVVSVNGKTGVVTGLYDADNPPPYPVSSVNGKTGVVTGLYDVDNPPPYPVSSVNGKTGDVTGLYDADNQPPYPVSSVNGKTGAVTGLYDADNQPPYPVSSVNGKTGAVTGLYSDENPPPYPVQSVNGKTGAVTGLYSAETPPPYPITSVNGSTGNVYGISQRGVLTAGSTITPGTQSWFIANPLPGTTLSPGNTGGFTIRLSGDINGLVPISACFTSQNGYAAQVSLALINDGLRVSITNHGVEGPISLGPVFICFTAFSNFTVTEVT